MTDEQIDAIGEAIEQDARERREVGWAIQAEQEAAERGYHCTTEGCAGTETDPSNRCDACQAVVRLAADFTIAEQIATGLVCFECGASFQTVQGVPTICADCGGVAPVTPWHIGGQYFSDPSSAHAARVRFIARRRSLVARIRRVEALRGTIEADARNDTRRAIDLAAFVNSTFSLTPAGRAALAAPQPDGGRAA